MPSQTHIRRTPRRARSQPAVEVHHVRENRVGTLDAPGDPERSVQLIDARDLAGWMLDLGERGTAGAFCATAPAGRTTMREVGRLK